MEKEMTLEEIKKAYNEMKESRDYWMDKANRIEKKFSTFREMMKGLVVLVE